MGTNCASIISILSRISWNYTALSCHRNMHQISVNYLNPSNGLISLIYKKRTVITLRGICKTCREFTPVNISNCNENIYLGQWVLCGGRMLLPVLLLGTFQDFILGSGYPISKYFINVYTFYLLYICILRNNRAVIF